MKIANKTYKNILLKVYLIPDVDVIIASLHNFLFPSAPPQHPKLEKGKEENPSLILFHFDQSSKLINRLENSI